MKDDPILRVVQQRHPADCCVAALSMLLGVSYEDALLAVGEVNPAVLTRGLYLRELEQGAKRLGVTLKRKRRYDLDADEGILNVVGKSMDHVVVLKHGLFFDTDASVWEPDVFLLNKKVKARTLLVRG